MLILGLTLLALRLFLFFYFGSLPPFKAEDWLKINTCLDYQPKGEFFYFKNIKIDFPADFGDCLEIKGKLTVCQKNYCLDNLKVKKKNRFFPWRKQVFFWQEKLINIYQRWLPEPEASLISGIVLGAKSRLPVDFYEKLQRSGALHIAVASGYNLTVISRKPTELLAWIVGRRLALVFGWIFVWLYVLLVGAEPPVVRAGLMISLIYLAQFLGKKFFSWSAFWLTIWLMLMVKPQLISSVSFQLSTGAMAGLLFFEGKWQKLRKIPLVGEDLTESLSTQVFVLPIIAFHFHQLAWLSPLTNIFILPLVPALMTLGLLALIFPPAIWLVYPLLWFVVKVVEFFGQ